MGARNAILMIVLGLGLLGCVKHFSNGGSGSGGTGGGGISGVTSAYALALQVGTSWEQHPDVVTQQGTCTIDVSTPAPALNQPCQVTVPQGQLFYSDLHITVGTLATCAYLSFTPYFYQASNSKMFTPLWSPGETIDCSGTDLAKIPHDCFSGPIFQFNSDWPLHVGTYFIPGQDGTSKEFIIPSANSTNRRSNRWTSNALDPAERNATLTYTAPDSSQDGYVAGTMVDYSVVCFDAWDQAQYSIVMTLSDQDTRAGDPDPNGSTNHHPDWNSIIFDPH